MIPPNKRKHGIPRGHVMVLTNAKDGPIVMGKKDTVNLADQLTEDGKAPSFYAMSPEDARSFIKTWHADRAPKAPMDELLAQEMDKIKAEFLAHGIGDVVPGSTVDEIRHDRDMLAEIIPRAEQYKPLTPAQHKWLIELVLRYEKAGIPLPMDTVKALLAMPVQGDLQPAKWPTLADEIIHSKVDRDSLLPPKLQKTMQARVARAEKLVLSADAVQRVADAYGAFPEQVALNGQFAIPPFDNCWIELPNQVWTETLGFKLLDVADTRVGFLFEGHRVYIAARSAVKGVSWSPVVYQLNTVPNPAILNRELRTIGCQPEDIPRFYWGQAFYDRVGHSMALRLKGQHGVSMICSLPEAKEPIWRAMAGDLPMILSILLALNTPSKQVISYQEIDRRTRHTHKGRVQLSAHRIVTIDLDKAPSVRLLSQETEDERHVRHVGWHTVRGHFVHDRKYRDVQRAGTCTHSGPDGDYWCEFEPNRWECLGCGSKRSWRTYPNGRGDRDKIVTHHYHVKG